MGTAVNGDRPKSIQERPLKGGIDHRIITAGYIVPYIVTTVVLFVLSIVLLKIIFKYGEEVQNFRDQTMKKKNISS